MTARICSVWRAAIIIVASCATAANSADVTGTFEAPRSYALPVRVDQRTFYLDGEIGGEKAENLVLDTGASVLVVSNELADRLRRAGALRDLPHPVRVGTASRKTTKLRLAEVRDVRFGEFVVPLATVAITDLTRVNKAAGMTLGGVAGMELFKSAALVVDFPGKQVRVEIGQPANTNGTVALHCHFPGFRPLINVELAGHTFVALIDSGFSEGFSVPRAKGLGLPLVTEPVVACLAANLADVT